MGKKAHIWRLPKGLMNGIAKLGGWLHLPLNPLRMQKLTENYVVSNAKIKAALGIEQMPVRAKDGLMETIKSFSYWILFTEQGFVSYGCYNRYGHPSTRLLGKLRAYGYEIAEVTEKKDSYYMEVIRIV